MKTYRVEAKMTCHLVIGVRAETAELAEEMAQKLFLDNPELYMGEEDREIGWVEVPELWGRKRDQGGISSQRKERGLDTGERERRFGYREVMCKIRRNQLG